MRRKLESIEHEDMNREEYKSTANLRYAVSAGELSSCFIFDPILCAVVINAFVVNECAVAIFILNSLVSHRWYTFHHRRRCCALYATPMDDINLLLFGFNFLYRCGFNESWWQ